MRLASASPWGLSEEVTQIRIDDNPFGGEKSICVMRHASLPGILTPALTQLGSRNESTIIDLLRVAMPISPFSPRGRVTAV